jgi:FkbM family methyltransferase
MSYSQGGEEAVILSIFEGQPPGLLLDIGAADGKTFSNSLALIERGWFAVLVEPSPTAFLDLLSLHGENPRVTLINAAVAVTDDLANFHYTRDLLSTTNADHKRRWEKEGGYLWKYLVAPISGKRLMWKLGISFDFLSIDIEGNSAELFLSLERPDVAPKAICIEHDGRRADIIAHAERWGQYETAYLDGNNLILRAH